MARGAGREIECDEHWPCASIIKRKTPRPAHHASIAIFDHDHKRQSRQCWRLDRWIWRSVVSSHPLVCRDASLLTLDLYRSRPSTSPKSHSNGRPPAVTTPSGGQLQSIAERMERLRASGAAGATPLQPLQRQVPSASRPSNPSETPSSNPPPAKPPKPLGLSTGRTPPGSPSPIEWDLVEDSALQRTGSAPASFAQSEVRDSSPSRESNGIIDRGPAGGVDVAPSRSTPYRPGDELASANRFPSLDDFERGVKGSSLSTTLPSVPSFDPSSGHPPTTDRDSTSQGTKAPLLDRATFEREQRERAEKMAALSAGTKPQYSSHAVPTSSSLPSSPARTTAPLPPPHAGSAREFHIPPSVEVQPKQLFDYLKSSKSETGQGPRVLLLDVRSREEYEASRIKGETVCLEPIVLREG